MSIEADQPNPVSASVARILDRRGEVVGAGFVVGPTEVATCAHVVDAALGRSPEDPTMPTDRVQVDLPLLGTPHASEAVTRSWRPVDPRTGRGDVAVLELAVPPPAEAKVPPLHRPDRVWGHRFRVLGFPAGMQDGVWSGGDLRDRQGTRWLQLQSTPGNPPIARGFSGAPVWDEAVGAVVGMAVAGDTRPGSTTAYLLPIDDVLGADPRLLPNPYRGLGPFEEEHADVFFGREDEIARLERLVTRQPLVAVVGPSGTGKSSLVRAGLFPRLRRRGIQLVELRLGPADGSPGVKVDRLADRLAAPAGGRPDRGFVLFADQFEELVGVGSPGDGPTSAQAVLHRLVELARSTPSSRVVVTLRWEAMGELLTDDLAAALDDGVFSLAPMSREQLRRAVVGPTARAPGLAFAPGLVERILDDAVAEPGQLPLVEALLTQLWESRQGGTITATTYERLGGVHGAVARLAEEATERLSAAVPDDDVRRLFSMLARPDERGGFVRRPVHLESLSTTQQQIVERLARSRLLVVGQDGADGGPTVELAHQALIDHWPRLRRWLDEDRDFLLWQDEVQRQRQAWESAGRDQGTLLRGGALAQAEDWLERRGTDVPHPVGAFVGASATAAARQRRRSLLARTGLGVAAALALVLGTVAVQQRRAVREEQAISSSRDLATLAGDIAAGDPALSMLLALEAHRRHPTPEAEEAVFHHYLDHLGADTVLSGAPGRTAGVEVSSDGRVVAARTSRGDVALWRRQVGRPVTVHVVDPPRAFAGAAEGSRGAAGREALAIALSEDGRRLVVVDARRAWIYDVEAGELRADLPVAGDQVVWVGLHGDGRLLVQYAGAVTRLELWDVDGEPAALLGERSVAGPSVVQAVGFGAGPTTVVLEAYEVVPGPAGTAEHLPPDVVVWDAATGKTESVGHDPGTTVVTPDGAIVTCRSTGSGLSLQWLDVRPGAWSGDAVDVDPSDLPEPATASCDGLAVSPDGRVAVVDGGAAAVDLRDGEVTVLPGWSGQDRAPVAVVADGERHHMVLDLSTRIVLTPIPPDDGFQFGLPDNALPDLQRAVRLAPGGGHVVSVANGGRDLVVGRTPTHGTAFEVVASAGRPPPHHLPGPGDLAIDGEGSLVADRIADDRVALRRLPNLEPVTEVTAPLVPGPPDPDDTALRPALAFHGDRLVTVTPSGARWWHPSTGELIDELDVVDAGIAEPADVDRSEVGIAVHPDPALVGVTVAGDAELHIVDVAAGRRAGTVPVGPGVLAAQFDETGRRVAVHRRDGIVEVWDVEGDRPIAGPLTGYETGVGGFVPRFVDGTDRFFVAFGGGGQFGASGTLRWYQMGSGLPERALDVPADDEVGDLPVDVSADASLLLSITMPPPGSPVDPAVTAVRLDPDAWKDKLCDLLGGRTFTADEVATLLDGHAPPPPCPS